MINKHIFTTLITLSLLIGCQSSEEMSLSSSNKDFDFNINKENMSVSGISAGAYMASQFHVTYSSKISGVAMLAGGPYWCARGDITRALGYCMKGGAGTDPNLISQYVEQSQQQKLIDDPSNINNDKVWIFHGAKDIIMANSVSRAIKEFYSHYTHLKNIKEVYTIDVNHGMPTISTGIKCDSIGESFLNACNYDAAGEILKTFYGQLNSRTQAKGELLEIDQTQYNDAQLLDEGYLYVPSGCKNNRTCQLHTVFHGCMQSTEFISKDFINGAGYNQWAESNNIVIFYPQVISSQISPMNPKGCWDWWGYTNENYANNKGPQMMAINAMMNKISGAQ